MTAVSPTPFSLIHVCSLFLKYLSFILFAITAVGIVPCGGSKKSPSTPSTVQSLSSFWPFDISEGILTNQKMIIGLDSFSDHSLIYLVSFGLY